MGELTKKYLLKIRNLCKLTNLASSYVSQIMIIHCNKKNNDYTVQPMLFVN